MPELSLNTLLKASIALISLILLIGIFVGNMVKWKNQVNDCKNNGYFCVSNDVDETGNFIYCNKEDVVNDKYCYIPPYYKDIDLTKICCMKK